MLKLHVAIHSHCISKCKLIDLCHKRKALKFLFSVWTDEVLFYTKSMHLQLIRVSSSEGVLHIMPCMSAKPREMYCHSRLLFMSYRKHMNQTLGIESSQSSTIKYHFHDCSSDGWRNIVTPK